MKLKVKEAGNGRGVSADKNFKSGEVVAILDGHVLGWRKLNEIGGIIQDNAYRFGPDTYLSPSGIGNYFNHSCEPNTGIVKCQRSLALKAIRPIKKGEEITFDYSTIIGNDDIWTMKCWCGAKTCRGRVRRFGSLPPALRDKYSNLGGVPNYIQKSLI